MPLSEINVSQDGLLHLYECAHLISGEPDYKRCGHIATSPGVCPFDHGEDVALVPLTALVLCADCHEPIMRDDSRAPDGRLICSGCTISYIARDEYRDEAAPNDPGRRP